MQIVLPVVVAVSGLDQPALVLHPPHQLRAGASGLVKIDRQLRDGDPRFLPNLMDKLRFRLVHDHSIVIVQQGVIVVHKLTPPVKRIDQFTK